MPVRSLSNESPEYRKLRAELLEAEVALQEQRERVAALRRTLPLDTTIDDYEFEEIQDGVRTSVRLSELFEAPDHTLVLMQFMYGKKQQKPCPMCTLWADGYDGIVPHLRQRLSFAVLVAGDVGDFSAYARSRGWGHLRLVSAAGSDLKRQLGFEDEDGAQWPGASLFRRLADGRLVHSYSVSASPKPGLYRGMDLLSPLWHFLDLTPEGRGEFMPKRAYER